MKTFKQLIAEVQQPLSQGEKNFKSLHAIDHKNLVPGVTDQDHIFSGNPRRQDPKTASYEIGKSDDESKAAYDKTLKVSEAKDSLKAFEKRLAGKAGNSPKDEGDWSKKMKKQAKGVKEEAELEEKTLTPAELKKREEVAKAIARENPGMDKSKKMAIATATAKKVAEEAEQVEEGKYNWDKEHKRGLTDTQGNRMLKKKALPSKGTSKEELRKIASKATAIGKVIESALSAKQKKIAKLSPPADKIDGGDLAALRRGEHKK